jgi:hypothetical protein
MFESRSCEYLAAISCKFGKPRQACLNSTESARPFGWTGIFALVAFSDGKPDSTFLKPVYARFPASANIAPCGSIAWAIQEPPGTSIGPLMIFPPPAVVFAMAASMSSTLK